MAHTSGKEQSLADRRELQRGRRVHSAHQISGKALWVRRRGLFKVKKAAFEIIVTSISLPRHPFIILK